MAAALQARGVGPGSHVALLGPTTRPFVTAIQATWLAGATVVVLPLPMRLASIEDFVAQTRRLIVHADAQTQRFAPLRFDAISLRYRTRDLFFRIPRQIIAKSSAANCRCDSSELKTNTG